MGRICSKGGGGGFFAFRVDSNEIGGKNVKGIDVSPDGRVVYPFT